MSSRTRKRNFQTPSLPFEKNDWRDDGSFESHGTLGSGSFTGTYEEVTDDPHPGYAARRKRGEIILGDFHCYKSSRGAENSTVEYVHPGWGRREISGDFGCLLESSLTDPIQVDADSYAYRAGQATLINAYAKMNKSVTCSLETVKDIGQTMTMLRKPFEGVQSLIMLMNKRRLKHLGKTAVSARKAAQSAWLEYRYGWKPLMMDIGGIAEELAMKHGPSKSEHLVARSAMNRSFDDNSGKIVMAGPFGTVVEGYVQYNRTVSTSSGVIYRINDSGADRIGRALGTRPQDLPASLWEIVPYSFVIDWFVNVGDWISAITPNPSVVVLGNWTTSIHQSVTESSSISVKLTVNTGEPKTYTQSAGGATYHQTSITRVCNQDIASLPVSTFAVLSLTHSIDAAAIFVGSIIRGITQLKH